MAKIVHEINGVLHSNLRHDLKTNIRDLRLPAAADSLKMHPQDSFRFKYAKNTSSFNQAWIAQLVEHLTSDLMVPGSIPGGGSFFYKSKDN